MKSLCLPVPAGKVVRGTAVFLLPSLLFLLLFHQLKAAPTAVHTIIAVNTTADELNSDGDCSLREAIQSANTNNKMDGCTFSGSGDLVVSVPAGSYFITLGSAGEDANAGGDFDLLASMTIQGAGVGSTVLDANLFDRLFDIDPAHSTSISVTIAGMTLQNGRPPLGSDGGGIRNFDDTLTVQESQISDGRLTGNSTLLAHGGGIFSGGGFSTELGVVHIISTTIEDNSSTYGSGGGIYNDGGLLNVSGSTIIGNSAQIISGTASAGGIANLGGTTNILNSAILDNESDGQAGGISNFFSFAVMNIANSTISGNRTDGSGGGIRNIGMLYLTNVTITNNTADLDAQFGGSGGGIRNQGILHLKGSIIFGNTDNLTVGDATDAIQRPDIYDTTTLVSEGYNMLGVITGTTTITNGVNEDLVGIDPQLGSRTGSPPYFPLSLVSPALNRIPALNCTFIITGTNPLFSHGQAILFDQAGQVRPDVSMQRCDVGAVEPPYAFVLIPFVATD